MRTIWKMALGVLTLGTLAACVPYDGYGDGYYGGGGPGYGTGYGGGYCDSFGCPDDYWDRPLYYGSVYYGNAWRNGPFYYRDWNGGRQYWLGGGWRDDGWRGQRPQQYRDGRTGPALGREWYRNNRPDADRGRDGRPGFNRDDRPRDGNRWNNRGQAQSQQQAQPQTSPSGNRWNNRGQAQSQQQPPSSGDGPRRGGRWRGGER